MSTRTWLGPISSVVLFALACGASDDDAIPGSASNDAGAGSSGAGVSNSGAPGSSGGSSGLTPDAAPGAPDDKCNVPSEAKAEDVSNPTTVIGTGTPASCTSAAFVAAVAAGGVITFDCGAAPTTITVTETAKVYNDTGPKTVIDGGGTITLSGGGNTRILYQNSCSSELHGGSGCNDTNVPALTVQNLTFVDGNASGLDDTDNDAGGGAIHVRGGRLKVVNCSFYRNKCDALGSDVGGGAIRVLDFPSSGDSTDRPVIIVNSTFGAENQGNECANGGALSSISASYSIYNSVFAHNKALGQGANDGQGGNGGAIYNDGRKFQLDVCGTTIENNHANEGGSAIFYVSNPKTGTFLIRESTFRKNPKGAFETPGFPGMFIIAAPGNPQVSNSTIE